MLTSAMNKVLALKVYRSRSFRPLIKLVASLAALTAPIQCDAAPLIFSLAPKVAPSSNRINSLDRVPRIWASGEFDAGAAQRLLAFARANRLTHALVVFDSPGGSLEEGLKLGQVLRALNFYTTIGAPADVVGTPSEAICASACAYAFAGGSQRFLTADSGRLGLHQFKSVAGAGSESDAQETSGVISAFLVEMGIDPQAFAVTTRAKPDEIIWLSADEAHALGFANNGAQPTQARIKLVDGSPFLEIRQNHFDGDAVLSITCSAGHALGSAGVLTGLQSKPVSRDETEQIYLTLDGVKFEESADIAAIKADDTSFFIIRSLSQQFSKSLTTARELGIWAQLKGGKLWGRTIELSGTQDLSKSFFTQCH